MDQQQTLLSLGIAIAVVIVATIKDRAPYQPGKLWVVPWRWLLAFALLAVLVLSAHMVSLMSGRPLLGRAGF